jgi:hypothetical protein
MTKNKRAGGSLRRPVMRLACNADQAASAEISVDGAAGSAGCSSPGARNPTSGPSSFCFFRAL